jgi:hypothetical protein
VRGEEDFDMAVIDQLTSAKLVKSLQSVTCPACGGAKVRRQTLCRRDYFRLPQSMRKALYNLLGKGYREAVAEALAFLDVTQPVFPPEK